MDRFGPRRMAVIGMTVCGSASIAAALLPTGLVPVAMFVALTLAALIGTNMPVMAAVNLWFHDRRALAIAVMLFAVSAVNLLPTKATTWDPEQAAGPLMILGVLVLALGVPAAWMLRGPARASVPGDGDRDAGGPGEQPTAADGDAWDDGHPLVDFGWKEAVRSRQFWLLVVGAAGVAATDQLVRALVFSLATERFEVGGSYSMFENVHQVVSVAFVLVGGLASMKVGLRKALLAFAALHVVAIVTLLVANGPGWLFAGMAILGAGHGGGIALGIAAIGEYFGRRRFATLLGTNGLLAQAIQGVLFGLLFAIRPGLNYLGLSVDVIWIVAMALLPSALSAAAYWKLGDPKPAPSQIALETSG